ncbi:helix-turn-helix domain-containing protein [Nonomuraea sp. NPDC004580]|uniref:helix-turn-helix domain-containing protein n=1 Tax=Nonomuraea sp. NPDC004580 TaxID=3154552 RepID=UPI0033AF7771
MSVDRLLTPDEVAALARVELRTVGVWRRNGRLRAVALPGGRVWRYRLMDVAAALHLEPTDLLAMEVAQ